MDRRASQKTANPTQGSDIDPWSLVLQGHYTDVRVNAVLGAPLTRQPAHLCWMLLPRPDGQQAALFFLGSAPWYRHTHCLEWPLLSGNQSTRRDAPGRLPSSVHQQTQRCPQPPPLIRAVAQMPSPASRREASAADPPRSAARTCALLCLQNVFRIWKPDLLKQGLIFTFSPVPTTHCFLIPYAFMVLAWSLKALSLSLSLFVCVCLSLSLCVSLSLSLSHTHTHTPPFPPPPRQL